MEVRINSIPFVDTPPANIYLFSLFHRIQIFGFPKWKFKFEMILSWDARPIVVLTNNNAIWYGITVTEIAICFHQTSATKSLNLNTGAERTSINQLLKFFCHLWINGKQPELASINPRALPTYSAFHYGYAGCRGYRFLSTSPGRSIQYYYSTANSLCQ